VGNLGVGIMNSMPFSLLANNNSKVDGNQISFGTIDFQIHPPTLTPIFASLDQEMDRTIRSLNFHVGSLGLTRLSDSTKLDPSAGKIVTIAISESSVGSSSEVNLLVNFATIEKREEKIEELDKLIGNLDIGEATGHSDLDKKDLTTQSGGVSGNIHQVCVIITEAAEENNDAGNLVVDTQDNNLRINSRKEKEKIYVSAGEWRIILSAINHGTKVPASRREVFMGYQYALHQHKKKLWAEKSELRKVRRAVVHQADHIGASTVRHRISAKKGTANQSIAEENSTRKGRKMRKKFQRAIIK
jgi:hypothetical protein